MLVIIILVLELLTIFMCVHRVYGQKLKINIVGIITYFLMFIIIYMVNYLEISRNNTYFAYLVLLIYCLKEFRERLVKTIVSMMLSITVLAVIQFAIMLILSFVTFANYNVRDVLGNILAFIVIWFVLPHCKVDKLRNAICKKHWLMYTIFVFIVVIVMLAIVSIKSTEAIKLGMFLFGIPSIVIIAMLVLYWDKSDVRANEMQEEIVMMNRMQNRYDELLERVRMNQHGFKNQMSAVLSTHYICKTYEELIEKQQEYCAEIYEKNRYNNILIIQNNFLAGFLYDKILEIEENNIPYEYKIETQLKECKVPDFYLIEMLGILIDNAIDATKENSKENKIVIEVKKEGAVYKFIIRNTYREVHYDEIMQWFKMGKTTKDNGQGIGLYRMKQLCNKWNCNIKCTSENDSDKTWIIFELRVEEKEDDV